MLKGQTQEKTRTLLSPDPCSFEIPCFCFKDLVFFLGVFPSFNVPQKGVGKGGEATHFLFGHFLVTV